MLSSAVLMLVVPAGALIASPMRLASAAAAASPATAARRTVRASAAASAGSGKFTEITPLKAAMLCKMWQGLLVEVDQKVGVVPELGGTSVGVQRFGPELERRTLCKRQFERFGESTFALSVADKAAEPAAVREQIECLELDGMRRGPLCCIFASLAAPATMSLVERGADEWSLLALTVNPTERKLEAIAAAEQAALAELCALAQAAIVSIAILSIAVRSKRSCVLAQAAGATVRVHAPAAATLAGDGAQLGLSPLGDETPWLRAAP